MKTYYECVSVIVIVSAVISAWLATPTLVRSPTQIFFVPAAFPFCSAGVRRFHLLVCVSCFVSASCVLCVTPFFFLLTLGGRPLWPGVVCVYYVCVCVVVCVNPLSAGLVR